MFNMVKYNNPSNVFDLMGSFFDDFYNPVVKEKKYAPLVDIYEKEESLFIEAQLPGMKKEDIKIEIDKGYLVLSAENCKENEVKEKNFYKKEMVKGKFMRSFQLPDSVNKDKLEAKFEDGILKIELPKDEVAKPKQISIN